MESYTSGDNNIINNKGSSASDESGSTASSNNKEQEEKEREIINAYNKVYNWVEKNLKKSAFDNEWVIDNNKRRFKIFIKNLSTSIEHEIVDLEKYFTYDKLKKDEYLKEGFKKLLLEIKIIDNNEDDKEIKRNDYNEEGEGVREEEDEEEDDESNTYYFLIMGQTGVGKTTFINSVINYFKWSSLEEAFKYATLENICTIPTRVDIYNENQDDFSSILCGLGGEFRNIEIGKSDTKFSRQYKVKLNQRSLIFIDTPGLCDTNSEATDTFNMQNILSEIQQLKKLNGILILMRNDDSRTTKEYLVLNEFLRHLDSGAINNIFFIFTRSTKPGSGLTILKKCLESDTKISSTLQDRKFFFDNVGLGILAATLEKGPSFFSESDKEQYFKTWEICCKQLDKLIKTVISIPHHDVQNTNSINRARDIISKLVKPMVESVLLIDDNIKINKKHKELLDSTIDLEMLKSKLYIQEIIIVSTRLEKNKLVCTKKTCCISEKVSTKDGNLLLNKFGNYCYEGVSSKNHWYSSLYWLNNFNKLGYCKICIKQGLNCKCKFSDHIIINSIEKKQIIPIQNPEILNIIKTDQKILQEKKRLILEMEEKQKLYLKELKIINQASVDFTLFLSHNSIVPISLYYEDYIEFQIKQFSNDEKKIKLLENHLIEHKNELEIQRNNIKNGTYQVITQSQIFELFKTIENLKLIGKTIKDIQFTNNNDNFKKSENKITINVYK